MQPPQSAQLPKRLLDLMGELRLPLMEPQQPVLADLAELLADDTKAMVTGARNSTLSAIPHKP
jgi:hypothetical protein